jgi:hypothetical protein
LESRPKRKGAKLNREDIEYTFEKLQSELAAKDKEIAQLKASILEFKSEWEKITEARKDELQAIRAQEPVAWIQSNHLQKLGQSDMCRCSNFKLMPDYIPLYAHPVIKEGFVSVPIEPTDAMCHAATMIAPTWDDHISRAKYKAMINEAMKSTK